MAGAKRSHSLYSYKTCVIISLNKYTKLPLQIEEFSKEADVKNLHTIDGHRYLIVWKWVDVEAKDGDCDSVMEAGYVASKS